MVDLGLGLGLGLGSGLGSGLGLGLGAMVDRLCLVARLWEVHAWGDRGEIEGRYREI